jgi:dTDP-4-amino-4,6-dideoxygalactose transaminase
MIKYWNYLDEYQRDRRRILEIVDRVFSSGRLILGPEVAAFEKQFAAYCGVAHGVGVNSCTDALFLALKTLEIGPGDEVITVANTAVPTIAAIRAAGAMPVFVDVEEETFLIEVSQIEPAITSRTKCILPVHLFGQVADMGPLLDIAARHGLKIIEDCAQAAGALYEKRKAGSFGVIGAFSFYPTKVLGGYGDGGMLITDHGAYYEKLRKLRFYGMREAYYAEDEGFNSRLDEIQAALLLSKLETLDESVRKRQDIAAIYTRELSGVGDIVVPVVRRGRTHQFYTYTIRTKQRDELMRYLLEHEIEVRINYPTPIHLMRGYGFLNYRAGRLPVTEKLSGEILSLPLYPGLAGEDVSRVVRTVRTFYGRWSRAS